MDEQEREELAEVVNGLDDLYKVISELRMMTNNRQKQKGSDYHGTAGKIKRSPEA